MNSLPAKRIDYWPHPLTSEGRRTVIVAGGATIQHAADVAGITPDVPAHAVLNGQYIPRDEWKRRRLTTKDVMQFRAALHGNQGDESNPIAVILTVAVLVAAPQLVQFAITGSSNPLLAAIASSQTLYNVAVAAVSVAGILAVNALFPPRINAPPADDGGERDQLFSISGGGNRARPGQPLLMVLGTHRMYPDLVAREYTEFRGTGSDQYLNQIFDFGIGDLDIGTLKFADTDLDDYEDVETEPSLPIGTSQVDTITLVAGNVDTLDGQDFDVNDTSSNRHITRTTPTNTTALAFDLAAQKFRADGSTLTGEGVTFQIRWKQVGGSFNAWQLYGIATPSNANARNMQRRSVYEEVTTGQYEIQIRLQNPIATTPDDTQFRAVLVAVRAFQPDEADFEGRNPVALRIKATGQLHGRVDRLNAVVSARIPNWDADSENWDTIEATSNPASILRWFLKGYFVDSKLRAGYGLDDDEIDMDSLAEWHEWCEEKELECNAVIGDGRSEDEIARMICQCGWARLDLSSGKWGVIYEDEDRAVSAVVNPTNIIANSLSINYNNENLADEFVGTFIDRDDDPDDGTPNDVYQENTLRRATHELINDATTTGEFPVTIRLEGITSGKHAAKMLNQATAAQWYHQRTISWEMDAEGLAIGIGDVVAMANGLIGDNEGGRLTSISDDRLTLGVTFEPSSTSGSCWIWHQDGSVQSTTYTVSSGNIVLAEALADAPDDEVEVPETYRIMLFDSDEAYRKVRIVGIDAAGPRRFNFTARDELAAYYEVRDSDNLDYERVKVVGVDLSAVEGFTLSKGQGNALIISWNDYKDQVRGYELRYTLATNAVWDDMTALHTGLYQASPYIVLEAPETGTGWIGIKAVVADGRMTDPAYFNVDLQAIDLRGPAGEDGPAGPEGDRGSDGDDGEDGVDGASAEFIFRRTRGSNATTAPPTPENNANIDDYVPPRPSGVAAADWWSDEPQGISATYIREWVSKRVRPRGEVSAWGDFSAPTEWARWPGDGVDGASVEFIFRRTADFVRPSAPNNDDDDASTDDHVPSGWTDDPTGTTITNPFEWMAQRFRSRGVGAWQAFHTPILWDQYRPASGLSVYGQGEAWGPNRAYSIGSHVMRNGALYEAISTHTSTNSNAPPSTLWRDANL